jgi:plasmid replication initiation protein
MFTEFKIDGDADVPYVDIRIYEKALPLLNSLDEWTRYSLQQFNELQSSYSKTMYRLLKQFRTKGFAYFSKEDLFELLDVPKSYQQGNGMFDKRVLKPIRQELTAIFKGLAIKKKYGKGRGKPVIGYQFTFKPEIKNVDDFNQHAPTKIEQDQALEKANKQLEIDEKETKKEYSYEDKIKQKEREIELLKQAKKIKENTKKDKLSNDEKKELLDFINRKKS